MNAAGERAERLTRGAGLITALARIARARSAVTAVKASELAVDRLDPCQHGVGHGCCRRRPRRCYATCDLVRRKPRSGSKPGYWSGPRPPAPALASSGSLHQTATVARVLQGHAQIGFDRRQPGLLRRQIERARRRGDEVVERVTPGGGLAAAALLCARDVPLPLRGGVAWERLSVLPRGPSGEQSVNL